MEMHKRKRMKNKLTKNIFRSTLYNFRADLFLIWRGFRARRKHRLASPRLAFISTLQLSKLRK